MKGRDLKPHIGIFGRRNNGKSSLINLITGQDTAIVSEHAGTTTDPVKKSIEIAGIGPVIVIDTAGIDDEGELGQLRVEKTKEVLAWIDLAIIVVTSNEIGHYEQQLCDSLYEQGVPVLFVHNKNDLDTLKESTLEFVQKQYKTTIIDFSILYPSNLSLLLDLIRQMMPVTAYTQPSLLADLVQYGDIVLLIVPIDIEAPEGRLILPQVQAIRDILDNDCTAIVVKEREVDSFLRNTGIKPKLAICDSSIFLKADASIPKDIPLTGFSVLLARYKGEFQKYLEGTPTISALKDGDRILLLESCTHHVSCDDIGRVKIPRWLNHFTGKKLEFDVVSGLNKLNRPITDYSLVVQCGGCMISRKQIVNRLKPAIDAGVPVTNYGMSIAYVQGVFNRAIAPFIKNVSNVDYL